LIRETAMSQWERQTTSDLADLAAVIERAATDLAIAEEPANFTAALDEGGRDE